MKKAVITIVRDDGESEVYVVIPIPEGATLHRFDAASGDSHLIELSDHLYELLKDN